jgi:diguanylate cyclase (GGDEF)-like protein
MSEHYENDLPAEQAGWLHYYRLGMEVGTRLGILALAEEAAAYKQAYEQEKLAREDADDFAEAIVKEVQEISRGVLHKREIINQLQEESKYATKTRLLTRDAFEQEAIARTQPVKRVKDLGKVHSLIFADLDDFKQLNETLGHIHVDDEILKPIGDILYESIRFPEDLASQFGGEEFVILLTETASDGALFVADKIRKLVNEKQVGISMGIVSFMQGDDFYRALEVSNLAMRRAKRLPGKNQRLVLEIDTEV